MKRLFLMVLAVNAIFFIWQMLYGPASPLAAKKVEPVVMSSEGSPDLVLLEESKSKSKNSTATPSDTTCYSLGPFVAANKATSALSRLKERGLPSTLRKAEGRKPKGYWVYFPPLDSREEAKAMLREVHKHNIDSFIITEGANKNGISVGVYSDETSAQRRQQELQKEGLDVVLEQRYTARTEYWLDVVDSGRLLGTASQLFKEFPGLQRRSAHC